MSQLTSDEMAELKGFGVFVKVDKWGNGYRVKETVAHLKFSADPVWLREYIAELKDITYVEKSL